MVATWREPKYDWTIVDGVAYTDLNRIEEDLQYLKEQLDAAVLAYDADILALEGEIDGVAGDLLTHVNNTSNPHSVTKEQLGLGDLEEDTAYVKLAGDTMEGGLIGHVGTDYTTGRFRNVFLSTAIPEDLVDGDDGDVWMQYE